MNAICPNCNHSLFDHSDDIGCDAKGCKCNQGFEETTSAVLSLYEAKILNLRQATKAMLMLVEAHTSEHTQYAFRETIAFAKDILDAK